MTRTTALKGVYFARLTGLVFAILGALVAARYGYTVLAAVQAALAAALLLSGRVQAYFWSELLDGLHFLSQRDYSTSKIHTERFLEDLRERPWLRHLIWLGPSSYTVNVEVLALNNLGAADIGLGNLDTARAHLDLAIKLDPGCPLLYRNMYTLLMRVGPYADAQPWLVKAAALGMKGGVTDRIVQSSQLRNAARSSTGRASSARMSGPLLKPPVVGAYVINLINDDVTPLEVVIAGLEKVFDMTGAEALGTALEVHKAAQAECAGFPDEITARRKADELQAFVQDKGYSLNYTVTPRLSS